MQTNSPEGRQLLAFIERIERLEEDKKQVSEDIKDVYAEAKGTGFDVKILRKVIAIRKQDRDKRREEEELTNLYLNAIGMGDLPLGRAAAERAVRETRGTPTPVPADEAATQVVQNVAALEQGITPLPDVTEPSDYERGQAAFRAGQASMIPPDLQGQPKRANDFLDGWGDASLTSAQRSDAERMARARPTGISSMTISGGGESVTIDASDAAVIMKSAAAMLARDPARV